MLKSSFSLVHLRKFKTPISKFHFSLFSIWNCTYLIPQWFTSFCFALLLSRMIKIIEYCEMERFKGELAYIRGCSPFQSVATDKRKSIKRSYIICTILRDCQSYIIYTILRDCQSYIIYAILRDCQSFLVGDGFIESNRVKCYKILSSVISSFWVIFKRLSNRTMSSLVLRLLEGTDIAWISLMGLHWKAWSWGFSRKYLIRTKRSSLFL